MAMPRSITTFKQVLVAAAVLAAAGAGAAVGDAGETVKPVATHEPTPSIAWSFPSSYWRASFSVSGLKPNESDSLSLGALVSD